MKFIYNGIFALALFLLGYFFGKFDVKIMVNKIIEKYEIMDVTSFISSLVTLLLFLAYIFGRILLIKKMEITIEETVNVLRDPENQEFNVVDTYNLGDLNSETIFLYSTEPLRWVKFYEYDFNNEKNFKGKLVKEHKILKNGEVLQINTYLNDGIPNYLVEYERFDYIKGEIILAENGKNGNSAQPDKKHNFKSYLYYLISK